MTRMVKFLPSACIALLLSGPGFANAQEARLGRLFYTPEERQKINEKRGVVSSANSAPRIVTVNGMIVRTGRPPVLFVDGKESVGAASNASAARQLAQGIPLKTESGQTIVGKPGQIIDLANGRAIENYQLVPNSPESGVGETSATQHAVPKRSGTPAAEQKDAGLRAPVAPIR